MSRPNIAIFVSGGGSNMRVIHSHIKHGSIPAKIHTIVTNKPDCGGAKYALDNDIRVLNIQPNDSVKQLVQELHDVEYVILAGYLKMIPHELVRVYKRRMLNIHPSLLPAFGGPGMYGHRVHRAVLDQGETKSGATVHFVDDKYDTGATLLQGMVSVYPEKDTADMLAKRVLDIEHTIYPIAVKALVEKRIDWSNEDRPEITW